MKKIFAVFAASALFVFGSVYSADAFVNPNDFNWLKNDFNTSKYNWMNNSGQNQFMIPGFPITLKNATFPPGWKVKHKDGKTWVIPPKHNDNKNKNNNNNKSKNNSKGRK